jgi:RNA polymerase sigma factor (sigma-70 family)
VTDYAYDPAKLGQYRVDPMAHYGLAKSISRKFRCGHLEPEDLEQEALCALCAAARTYDPTHGTTFATWATLLIRAHLAGVIGVYRRVGSLGGRNKRLIPRVVRKHLMNGGSTNPEVLRGVVRGNRHWENASDWDLSVLAQVFLYWERSLDAEEGGGVEDSPGAVTPMHECVENPEALRELEDRITEVDIERRMSRTMRRLRPRQRELVERRVFPDLRDEDVPTLESVGEAWDVTRQRVQQVEADTLYELQKGCEVLLSG